MFATASLNGRRRSLAPETQVAGDLRRDGEPLTLSLTLGLRPLVPPEK